MDEVETKVDGRTVAGKKLKESRGQDERIPTEETVQKAAELSKEQIQEKLEALEAGQDKILKTLREYEKRIRRCEVQR